jgi:hypothetical protein
LKTCKFQLGLNDRKVDLGISQTVGVIGHDHQGNVGDDFDHETVIDTGSTSRLEVRNAWRGRRIFRDGYLETLLQ